MPDNCLVHLGRRDSIVKVRGHRVDVTHVEQSLRDLASVTDAAIVVTRSNERDVLLVAYIVASNAQSTVERDIRRDLARSLPDFMIPSAFVFIETMPTTAMGKTDRARLRLLAPPAMRRTAPADAPQTPIEKEIAAIWAEVLDHDQVGLQDNFFELGGSSLSVMQVVSRIQQRFAIDLPIVVLFRTPTVRGLALHVSGVLRARLSDTA
jgi:nonribosomal peptide synthetase DhbF